MKASIHKPSIANPLISVGKPKLFPAAAVVAVATLGPVEVALPPGPAVIAEPVKGLATTEEAGVTAAAPEVGVIAELDAGFGTTTIDVDAEGGFALLDATAVGVDSTLLAGAAALVELTGAGDSANDSVLVLNTNVDVAVFTLVLTIVVEIDVDVEGVGEGGGGGGAALVAELEITLAIPVFAGAAATAV